MAEFRTRKNPEKAAPPYNRNWLAGFVNKLRLLPADLAEFYFDALENPGKIKVYAA